MRSYVGIDVGGTYTDAVLIQDGRIAAKGKVPTQPDNLLESVLQALDSLGEHENIEQITVSTTLVTNAILQQRLPAVELLLFPGTGMKLDSLTWPVSYQVLSGEIDYRGREITPPDELEWRRLINKLNPEENSTSRVAIVGKFSHRNKLHEEKLAAFILKRYPNFKIALGHEWGQANFYRRSLTTYLNLATTDLFNEFAQHLQDAVAAKGITAPIRVLKADGGVLPLEKIRPVESIYSGPAASVLGALAQSAESMSFVIVDIGGTTTDIGLVLSGKPLLSSRAAQIGPFSTLVHSLAVRSIPIGGDSVVIPQSKGIALAGHRLGPAYCLGGKKPTPTDAMRYLNLIEYGDFRKAEEALASLLPDDSRDTGTLRQIAEEIINQMVERIAEAIENIHKEWKEEPAYKVWEVLHPHDSHNFHVWVSGGGAQGLAQALGKKLHTNVRLGKFPEVSNAIGAAMAKPTFSCTLHLDTYLRKYRIEETGEQGEWTGSKRPHQEVEEFLAGIARRQAMEKGIGFFEFEKEPFDYFPIVKGYQTVGQIIRGSWHISPGVTGRVKE